MKRTRDVGPEDLSGKEDAARDGRASLRREIYGLSAKSVVAIAGTWISLYVFESFFGPLVGITHFHVQVAGIIATIVISFGIITAIRRLLKKFANRVHPQFSASISFFAIIVISLVAALSVLHQLDVNPQEILISGGVVAIIVGIGVSTIVGNILSSGLILTTYPAKIGDAIHVVNDNVHGTISEVNMIYTRIQTDEGREYIVPNNAIIQGSVRIVKDVPAAEMLPYAEGDRVEISGSSGRYAGMVIRITPNFTTILDDDRAREYIIANSAVLGGGFAIVRYRKGAQA